MYRENPKTKGSGIMCAIPQSERCPNNCPDCFFQSGRSYLEPLEDNLPNMPSTDEIVTPTVIRVNDGNDSSIDMDLVMDRTRYYKWKFYNTVDPTNLESFDAPVVLTVNPVNMTDSDAHFINHPPRNLMFVRARTNTWNRPLINDIVTHYSKREIPIVLTFMAYHDQKSIPGPYLNDGDYIYRQRTQNSYWAITTKAWEEVMSHYKHNKWVYSCGKIEGELGDTHCRFCGNCLREYFATMEKMKKC